MINNYYVAIHYRKFNSVCLSVYLIEKLIEKKKKKRKERVMVIEKENIKKKTKI